MQIQKFNEYINESVIGEQTVRLIGRLIMDEYENILNNTNRLQMLYNKTYYMLQNDFSNVVSDYPKVTIVLNKYNITPLQGKINQKVYESIYNFDLEINFLMVRGYYAAKALFNSDNEEYNVRDLYIDIFLDNNYMYEIKSITSSVKHEIKHYYDYIISDGKAMIGKIKVDETEYLNSQHELSARFTQFIHDNMDNIVSGNMTKLDIMDGLNRVMLKGSEFVNDANEKWAIKKAIGYINNITSKNRRKRIDIKEKIESIANEYGLKIVLADSSSFSPYYIKNGNLSGDAINKLSKLCDIYRYDLIIGNRVKIDKGIDMLRYEFLDVKKIRKSTAEDLMTMILHLPPSANYYRESKRK